MTANQTMLEIIAEQIDPFDGDGLILTNSDGAENLAAAITLHLMLVGTWKPTPPAVPLIERLYWVLPSDYRLAGKQPDAAQLTPAEMRTHYPAFESVWNDPTFEGLKLYSGPVYLDIWLATA